ncbi:AGE family epimerase/isomerase [Dysgonomonas sp. 520]|uniref:AGE family epimerase/isomerase n=1 Tax=Dysgonomonas sp. 520 TaxID=2302931 RepID=UPI0013D0E0E8|nr:AGE family epimerase/isomerase [Dysgonomonas sp. 520]NDW11127.1 N-acyl-D-glucosamine 2-epimerase [Dysgonomonas sp. 520]
MKGFKEELVNNILPFWIKNVQDVENGGFYGRIDGDNILHPYANKGAILNARILWTFSAAYRLLKIPQYLIIAQRAFDYITKHFLDRKNGGIYWELDYKGNPVNTKKQTYVQGFALYGFSEYYRASGNPQALELSKDFFLLIEDKCKDKVAGGYFEAFTEEWNSIDDMRLSEKDANEKKTMNTHLHILEPYTNLSRIWNSNLLENAQTELIEVFMNHIINKETYHLNLFFDEQWNVKSSIISYGHDIEASWLLYEAAEILGDKKILGIIKEFSLAIADAASEGIMKDGSLIYEKEDQKADSDRHWWVQAEAVVGFMYAFKNSGKTYYKHKAERVWNYIQEQIIDKENGDWFWSRLYDGSINRKEDKAGFWKCPYHNSRMCLEMIENKNE